jgi:hypothetical protein
MLTAVPGKYQYQGYMVLKFKKGSLSTIFKAISISYIMAPSYPLTKDFIS